VALKDFLVCLDQTEASARRLRLAIDLAARHGSRLTVLYLRDLSPTQLEERRTAELGLVTADQLDRMNEWIEASIKRQADRLKSVLDDLARPHGLATEWRSIEEAASAVVAQYARYADLCVLGRDPAVGEGSVDYSFSEKLLFVTGRPVLFIPPVSPPVEADETLGRHIAIAWNSSRQAARAVNDAMPLIERSERTSLITVNPAAFIDSWGAPPAEQMLEHLRRHGAPVDLVTLDGIPTGSIAHVLQSKSRELGADLLVAGAFGHPKLWEKLLGGVTRDLLDHMSLPILMSH
jgi:nucleotide-binding universal stress UspA family protein